jgi:hypothetical protein
MSVFAVSKVRLDPDGRVTAVLWGKVDTQKNEWAEGEEIASAASAVDAIESGSQVFALFPTTHGHLPDRRFMVVEYENGWKTIALEGPPTFEREVHDMDHLHP